MRTPDDLTALFRANQLKVTPQRLAVFEALHGDDTHPTAEVVHARVRERMPTVSLRTVYQALNDLVDLGEVRAVSVDNGAVRFDPNNSGHDHFVCRDCGRVSDVTSSRPRLVAATGGEVLDEGYTVDTSEIIFRGRCAACNA